MECLNGILVSQEPNLTHLTNLTYPKQTTVQLRYTTVRRKILEIANSALRDHFYSQNKGECFRTEKSFFDRNPPPLLFLFLLRVLWVLTMVQPGLGV